VNRSQNRFHKSNPARSIQAVAAILLLQVNLALAAEPSGTAAASVQTVQPAQTAAPLQTHQDNIPLTSCNTHRATRLTLIAARPLLRRAWRTPRASIR